MIRKNKNKNVGLTKSIRKGGAMRTRDEYLKGGVQKLEYSNNLKQYYRVVYVIDINSENDLAVVRRTSKKGRHLKSKPQYKFHEEVYVNDNNNNPIRLNNKFVRSVEDDIVKEDVDYILKRCNKYPDTYKKLSEFKNRNKKKSPKD